VIILAIGYFLLPKIISISYDKNVFIFLGGIAFTTHLTLVARETKGHNFTAYVNYLFIFTILYILNLILLALYFRVGFNVHVGKVIVEGIKGGAGLIQSTFAQVLR
jgi:Trk-type K+ transport system membrane component